MVTGPRENEGSSGPVPSSGVVSMVSGSTSFTMESSKLIPGTRRLSKSSDPIPPREFRFGTKGATRVPVTWGWRYHRPLSWLMARANPNEAMGR